MIRGTLFKPSRPSNPVLSTGIPLISATIKVPRLSIENSVVLFADTGADRTSLHLRDAVRIFGLRKYRQLINPTDVKGVGGPAEYYVEPALIAFKHEDGKPEGFGFDLQIAKPSDKATTEFRSKMYPWTDDPAELDKKVPTLSVETLRELTIKFYLPAVLGRDIMSQFRVVIDWISSEFYMDH